MTNRFHRNLIDFDNHAVTAKTYATIAARDTDTAFHGAAANVNKVVRVDDNGTPDNAIAYYLLVSTAPIWLEVTNTSVDEFIELIDTPPTYTGQAGKVLQVNATPDAVEFSDTLIIDEAAKRAKLGFTGTALAKLHIENTAVSDLGIFIQGITAQSANMLQIEDAAAATMFSIGNQGATLFQNTMDSSNGFEVKDAASASILNIDTSSTDKTVTVSKDFTVAAATLFVDQSELNVKIGFTGTGNAKLHIKPDSVTKAGIQLDAPTGSTAELLTITEDLIGNPLLIMNNKGKTSFENSVDSSSGFQIFKANDGTAIFNVDTANKRIGIITNFPTHTLHVFAKTATTSSFGDAIFIDSSFVEGVLINFQGIGAVGHFQGGIFFQGRNSFYNPATDSYHRNTATESSLTEWTGTGEFKIRTAPAGTADTDFTPDTVLTISNTGQTIFQNSTDSTTGFQILDADGGTPIFNVDTTNEFVGIGLNNPAVKLDIVGSELITGSANSRTLELNSVTGSLLLNRLTEAQRDALTPVIGMLIFNTTANEVQQYNGTWVGASQFDTFLELTDTPASYSGQAGNVVQVNVGETALEFGQALRTTDSPTFANLTISSDLTVDTNTLFVDSGNDNVNIGFVSAGSAKLHIKTIAAAKVGLQIEGFTAQTGNLLNIVDVGATNSLFSFSAVGHFANKNTSDNTAAFNVKSVDDTTVFNISTITKTVTIPDLEITIDLNLDGAIEDRLNSKGTLGQVLSSTGTQTEWIDKVNTFLDLSDTPASYTSQAGNVVQVNARATALEFGQDLNITANVTFNQLTLAQNLFVNVDVLFVSGVGNTVGINTSAATQELHVVGNARLTGAFFDSNNSAGTMNQVLSSTITGTDWIDVVGDVTAVGTPVDNQLAIWTGPTSIEGVNALRFVSGANPTLVLEPNATTATAGLTDLTIFQGTGTTTKGLTLSGSAPTTSTTVDGVSLFLGNTGGAGGVQQLFISAQNDLNDAAASAIRVVTGLLVPNISGINPTSSVAKNISLGSPGNNVGIGFIITDATTQTTLDGVKLFIKSGTTTNVGLVTQGEVSQTADLFQARNSSAVSLVKIEEDGDIIVSAVGSSSGTPRKLQMLNGPGEFNQFLFGGVTGMQSANGHGLDIFAFHTIRIFGDTTAGIPPFSIVSDVGVQIINTIVSDPAVVIDGAAAQTGSLLQFRTSVPAVLSEFDEAGKLVVGGTKLVTAADRSMLDVRGSVAFERVATAVSVSTVDEVFIGVTAVPVTVTISTADVVAGRIFIIKDESGSATNPNPITIDTQGSELIDGVASVQITAAFGVVRLYSNGTNLFSW